MEDVEDVPEGVIETTQPGGGLLMRVTGESEAYMYAGSSGTVDVEQLR